MRGGKRRKRRREGEESAQGGPGLRGAAEDAGGGARSAPCVPGCRAERLGRRRRRRRRRSAPAAILGSLCGGGDVPGLGRRTRLPSVSPSRPTPLASPLALPSVRSPAGRLLTSGRVTVWTQRSRGARLPPPLPTCLHSALSASHGKEMLVASFGKPYIFMEQCSVKVL